MNKTNPTHPTQLSEDAYDIYITMKDNIEAATTIRVAYEAAQRTSDLEIIKRLYKPTLVGRLSKWIKTVDKDNSFGKFLGRLDHHLTLKRMARGMIDLHNCLGHLAVVTDNQNRHYSYLALHAALASFAEKAMLDDTHPVVAFRIMQGDMKAFVADMETAVENNDCACPTCMVERKMRSHIQTHTGPNFTVKDREYSLSAFEQAMSVIRAQRTNVGDDMLDMLRKALAEAANTGVVSVTDKPMNGNKPNKPADVFPFTRKNDGDDPPIH